MRNKFVVFVDTRADMMFSVTLLLLPLSRQALKSRLMTGARRMESNGENAKNKNKST